MEGWIKLHRRFLEWEWYNDEKMVKLFIHLMLTANREDKKWRGHQVKRGQLITGYHSLSEQVNMSVKVLRNRLDKMEKSGEIGRQMGNQFSVITIINYESYQGVELPEGKQMGKQRASKGQAKGKQRATTKEVKNIKKDKKMSELSVQTSLDDYEKIAVAFWNLIDANLKKNGINSTDISKAKYKGWVDPIRLAITNDGRTKSELTSIYKFLEKEIPGEDGFSWNTVIRSTAKLREKFESLLLAAKKPKRSSRSIIPTPPTRIEPGWDPNADYGRKPIKR